MNNPLDAAGAVVRPAPADELEQTLYEVRRKIYPRAVHGWFAGWRWALIWLTQLLFYGLPWLEWNGRQAVLFDLAARKFYIFGFVFWPQDFIYLTVLLIICGAVAVPLHRDRRAAVVRLRVSADGLHRDLHVDRAQDRGRPQRAHEARRRAVVGARKAAAQGGQARRLDRGRAVDRLHLRRLLHADPRTVARSPRVSDRTRGKPSGSCSTASPPTATPAGCASRSASTCARTRASRA